MLVGECLVGRHGSGVAVERCAVFGAGRVGSVLLPGSGLLCRRSVGGSVIIALHVVRCCLRPHTIIPLPWRERGIQFPQHKNKHTSQARGDEARKAQGTRGRGKEKEPTPRVPREVGHCAGALPHPFRGREESCKHIQAMWGQLGPTIQLILPQCFLWNTGSPGKHSPLPPV
eukprot:scaffold4776_cov87-Isochrysis_galbana.AAC.3